MTYGRMFPSCAATLLASSLAACSTNHTTTSPAAGFVSGSVSTPAGHLLRGVFVKLTPATGAALPAVKTDTTGFYAAFHVPPGTGSITVSGAPAGCTGTSPAIYDVQANAPTTLNIRVSCP